MKSLEGSHVLRVVFPKVSNSIEQEKISAANTNRWRQLVTKPVESAVDITWEYIGFCMQAAGRLGMSPKQTTTFSSLYPVAVLPQRASKGQGKQSWRKNQAGILTALLHQPASSFLWKWRNTAPFNKSTSQCFQEARYQCWRKPSDRRCPSLKVLKATLDDPEPTSWFTTLPVAGGWNWMSFKVSSHPNHSVILFHELFTACRKPNALFTQQGTIEKTSHRIIQVGKDP